jgi:hypothetical protein
MSELPLWSRETRWLEKSHIYVGFEKEKSDVLLKNYVSPPWALGMKI